MATFPDWLPKLFSSGGALAGIYSFLRLMWGDWSTWRRKARLKIEFDPTSGVRTFTFTDTGWVRKVAVVEVRNRSKGVAKRCVGVLRVISEPPGVHLQEREFTVHWAGVDYYDLTSGADCIDIGPEQRKLDLVFTQDHPPIGSGAWVAIPMALSSASGAPQAHLPPGTYKFLLKVHCENGRGDSLAFTLVSPDKPQDLAMFR
jgi:hypothetical protein